MWGFLKDAISLAATLVERPGEGDEKKGEVREIIVDLVSEYFPQIPTDIVERIVDYAIDYVVEWLNDSGWIEEEKAA